MEKAKEFDVVVTHGGTKATILEVYDTEPTYYAQKVEDDELVPIRSDEVKEVIYKAEN